MTQAEIKLSILIVNYGADVYLKECVASLLSQRLSEKVEIIIIQNGPGEDPDFRDGRIKVIRNERNEGFASANNIGLESAKGELLLMLNPDTVVFPGVIQKCIRMMSSDPEIGILGCKLINGDGSLQSSCRNFPGIYNILAESFGLHRVLHFSRFIRKRYLMIWPHDTVRAVDSVKGAFMMTRRKVVDTIGVLDDHFFMYCEEVDFCLRAKEKGWKTVFTPDIRIIHYGGKSTEINTLKNLIELHKSYRYYCRKHFPARKSVVCIALYFSGVAMRSLMHIEGAWSRDENKRTRFRLFYETAKSYFQR
jgi:N-acetylglucosaminyl-diphospho-decaprenol L-rhamnosyltransferase